LFVGKDVDVAVRELMEMPPSKELDLPESVGEPVRKLLEKLGLPTNKKLRA